MTERQALVEQGKRLEYFTIGWNTLEGVVAVMAGALAGSISLVAFGFDSFIEVTSGSALLWRMSMDADLHRRERAVRKAGSFVEGFRYLGKRPDLLTILGMLFLIMTFGINFPVFISAMAVKTFAAGSSAFGALSSMLAVGSVTGALFAARREKPRLILLLAGTAIFGVGLAISAVMPTYALFGISLVLVGWSAQTFNTTANSSVQLLTEPVMRGRVMAVYMGIAMGCTPLGAPLVGWVADAYGPRWSIAVGACSGFLAALLGVAYLVRYRGLTLKWDRGIPRFSLKLGEPAAHSSRAEYRAPDPQTK